MTCNDPRLMAMLAPLLILLLEPLAGCSSGSEDGTGGSGATGGSPSAAGSAGRGGEHPGSGTGGGDSNAGGTGGNGAGGTGGSTSDCPSECPDGELCAECQLEDGDTTFTCIPEGTAC
jgi:hypothetical protein